MILFAILKKVAEKEEIKSSENCEDCGKPESECECEESDDEMEESDSAKKMKESKKENSKEEKGKFPFDKFKKFDKSKASLPEKVSHMLEAKINVHNEKFEQNISFAQISKVYSRGLNVFNTTHKPGVSLHQGLWLE